MRNNSNKSVYPESCLRSSDELGSALPPRLDFSIVDSFAYACVTSEHFCSPRFASHGFRSVRRCINLAHGCCGKHFRFVGMYHHQWMLLAGLHCHHRPVGAIGRLALSPSTSSCIDRRHVGTSVSARTLKPARRATAVVGYPAGGQGSKWIIAC